MTLTAYAKLRGCSTKSVSLAIKSGRLVACVGRDEHGRPTILDQAVADREWTANTRAQSGAETRIPVAVAVARIGAAIEVAGVPRATVPDYNTSRAARAAAGARREAAMAELAELELAERRGAVVPAAEARGDVINAYSLVKTRLLGVSSRVAQRLPHLAGEVVPVLDEMLREALEELST